MEQRFLAKSSIEHCQFIGIWDDVCDLDNRSWDITPMNPLEEAGPEPLAYLEIVPTYRSGDDIVDVRFGPIYSHHELMGVYLG